MLEWWEITLTVLAGVGTIAAVIECILECFNGAILDYIAFTAIGYFDDSTLGSGQEELSAMFATNLKSFLRIFLTN